MKSVLQLVVTPDAKSFGWQFAEDADKKILPPFLLAAAALQLQTIVQGMLSMQTQAAEVGGIEAVDVQLLNRLKKRNGS